MSPRDLTFPLIPRRRIAGLPFGTMSSRRRGVGSDPAGSRPYRLGDDPRRIDHRASARLSAARNSEEFIVREFHAEESLRVVIVVDRRPSMSLFPEEFPEQWLRKPAAIVESGCMIVDSAVRTHCPVGYLDYAREGHADTSKYRFTPFWRPPNRHTQVDRVKERNLPYPSFCASEQNLSRAFSDLIRFKRDVPSGSFVFVLSDFIVCPEKSAWKKALARSWDIVPVIIQDPLWEQSFPEVAGTVIPFVGPSSNAVVRLRFNRREVHERRKFNETRKRNLLKFFNELNLETVVLSSHNRDEIYEAFLAWADKRRYERRR